MNTRAILFACAALVLGGCSNLDIKDIDAWADVDIERSEFAPDKAQLAAAAGKPKVVVDKFVEPDDNLVRKLASLANLSSVMAGSAEDYLTQAGVEVVGRNEAQTLLNEVRLAETKGRAGQYQGPQVVQYAIVGRVDGVDTSSKFQEAYCVDTKEGRQCYPPKCTYKADVTGRIRIYTVPQLRVVKSIKIQDDATKIEDTRSSNTCTNRGATGYTALIRDAGEQAVKGSRIEFQNFFAPKGYISDMRTKENQYIVKITIGKNRGIDKGSLIEIFTKKLEEDELTGETIEEDRKIASGKVTSEIRQSYAWVLLDKPERAARIKIGDFVKLTFKKGAFEIFTDVLDKIPTL